MLRFIFLLLVFLNLVVYAYSQGYFGAGDGDAEREPQRLSQQLNPEAMRLIRRDPEESSKVVLCRVVSGLNQAQGQALAAAVQAAAGGWRARLLRDDTVQEYRLVIGDLAGRAALDKKKGELRALGLTDLTQEEAGGQYMLVLSSYSDEVAAKDGLAALVRKGVRSARLESRNKAVDKARVEIRATAALLQRGLAPLLAPYSGLAITDCPAP